MSGKKHTYRANGLMVESEIELPELMPSEGTPNVRIGFGETPERLEGDVFRGALYEAGGGQYLLRVPRVARYWVKDRGTVIVTPSGGAPEDIRVFILSSVMGVMAHYNAFFPLHASAVEVNGGCVLFAGDSGSGKSTTAAAFHNRGYRVVADDICAVSLDALGRPLVHPGYRHLKLWGDALDRVGESLGERRRMRVGMQKFSTHVPGEIAPDPLPIRRIFVLTTELAETVTLHSLNGRARMLTLRRQTYRYRLLRRVGSGGDHFRISHALATHTPIVQVRRPFALTKLSELIRVLEEDVNASARVPA